jgi:hypothetical protein
MLTVPSHITLSLDDIPVWAVVLYMCWRMVGGVLCLPAGWAAFCDSYTMLPVCLPVLRLPSILPVPVLHACHYLAMFLLLHVGSLPVTLNLWLSFSSTAAGADGMPFSLPPAFLLRLLLHMPIQHYLWNRHGQAVHADLWCGGGW